MPTWINNKLSIMGNKIDIEELVEKIGIELDFELIIPIHPSLIWQEKVSYDYLYRTMAYLMSKSDDMITVANLLNITVDKVRTVYNRIPTKEEIADGEIYYTNYRNTGYFYGMEYCREKWGTKWNSCDTKFTQVDDNLICYDFLTAWVSPTPIFVELSKQFPNLLFSVISISEDTASPTDISCYSKGQQIK